MATESGLEEASESGGTTRRSALKLGVGAGVGLAAWSGASITSLGGTPVYASGCTFVINIDLSGGCRNTDQGNCQSPVAPDEFGYHVLKSTGFPAGYSLSNNISEGTCCSDNSVVTLNFPAGITCLVTVSFHTPAGGGSCNNFLSSYTQGPSSSGTLNFTLMCPGGAFPASGQYRIVAKCNTTGAPPNCIT